MMHRQGDLLLVKVKALPKGLTKKQNNVFAYGEVTGHSHRLKTKELVTYEDSNGDVYADLAKSTELIHEEHNPIKLDAGVWQVIRQREYSPSENRRVLD